MKRVWAHIAGLALLGAVGLLLFTWSGFYNVGASSGHWPAVAWLLRFTMQNSVETHALLVDAPPLDDFALIEQGAGHHETGCLPCHGAPGSPRNRIPNYMVPEPPYLPTHIEQWTAEELFWLVKHGLKYTGMPAWPAQSRDDEVWAVTAFLLRLPDLSPEEYASLAGTVTSPAPMSGESAIPETPGELFSLTDAALIGACTRCHGLKGSGRPSGAFPRLDLQTPEYLMRALTEYAEGIRPSGIMQPVAAALSDAQVRRLAEHYGESQPTAAAIGNTEGDEKQLNHGLELAAIGSPERGVPPCSGCHGLEGGPANPLFPSITGQYADYIRQQLILFAEGRRGGGSYADIMETIATKLDEADIEAVALYYASLPASPMDRPDGVDPSRDEGPR